MADTNGSLKPMDLSARFYLLLKLLNTKRKTKLLTEIGEAYPLLPARLDDKTVNLSEVSNRYKSLPGLLSDISKANTSKKTSVRKYADIVLTI